MASINTYELDSTIDPNDKVIGTDGTLGADAGKTKNFTISSLQSYIGATPWNTESGTGINYTAGNVGIGAVSGDSELTVSGEISSTNIETGSLLVEGNATIDDDLSVSNVTAATVTSSNDVEVSTVAKGFVLKSPDGTRFRIAVANDGTLSASAV